MAHGDKVEIVCTICGQPAWIAQSRVGVRDRRCDKCRLAGKRTKPVRTYHQQVNPKTDLQWQPKPNDPRRPPAVVLKRLRKRYKLGLPLAGCEKETDNGD